MQEKSWERKGTMREWDVGKNDKDKERDKLRREERPSEKRRHRTPERSPEPGLYHKSLVSITTQNFYYFFIYTSLTAYMSGNVKRGNIITFLFLQQENLKRKKKRLLQNYLMIYLEKQKQLHVFTGCHCLLKR